MLLLEAWVEFSRKIGKPFFVFVNLNCAHLPFEPRESFFSDYVDRYHVEKGQIYEPVTARVNSETGVLDYRKGQFAIGEDDFRAL